MSTQKDIIETLRTSSACNYDKSIHQRGLIYLKVELEWVEVMKKMSTVGFQTSWAKFSSASYLRVSEEWKYKQTK